MPQDNRKKPAGRYSKKPEISYRKEKKPNKPYRRTSQLPLDDSHLVQRDLIADTKGPFSICKLKSTTRHPTVFRKRIAEVTPQPKHGDIVKVVADDGKFIGFGTWNPRAEATVRILRWEEAPPTVDWWKESLRRAIELRTGLMNVDKNTEAYRIINAEGDGFPGLVVDRYGPVVSVQAFTLGMYQRAESIAKEVCQILGLKHWVVRPGPSTIDQEGFIASGMDSGNVPTHIKLTEYGIKYIVQPFEGHKTGFFCDQRDNRVKLRDYCKGKTVLDLCCYSGGFSLNAVHAKATSVTAVDLDEGAIEFAKQNAKLNNANIKFVHADAFAYMRDMQRNKTTFDVVILDPPKLIRNHDEEKEGQKKYFDLNSLAANLVNPGGLLFTCSCSGLLDWNDFTMTVRAATSSRNPVMLQRTGPSADHPVAMNCLESDYLKCLWMTLP